MQNIFFPFSFVFHLAFYFFLFVLITNFFRFFISFLVITGAHSNTKSREKERERERKRERERERERERLLAVALYLCYAVDRSIVPLFILLFAIISFFHSFFVRFSPLLNRHLKEKETINQSTDKN